MNSSFNPVKERLYSLKEIIDITGHANTRSAYALLRSRGVKPDSYRPASRAPVAVYRRSVVMQVFSKQLAQASRIKKVPVEELL